jgi:hypothetical protein
MEEVKKRGRKKINEEEKVILVSVYLKKSDKKLIVDAYGSVTNAVKQEVLSKLNKLANL